jgi:uncharacterized protein (DUF1499 family)
MLGVTRILAWLITAAVVIGVLMIVVSGPGHRFGMWDFTLGLTVLVYGLFALIGAVAAAVIWGILRIFAGSTGYGRQVLISVAVALLVAAYPLYQISVGRSVPPIHDITTDTVDPPAFVAVLPQRAQTPGVNKAEYAGAEVADQQAKAYPDIKPITSAKPPAEMFARALATANELGWEIVDQKPGEGRIEATATSMFFGFKDDIVIRIRAEGTGSRLDIRSKSRVGRGDVGANANRIRAFRDKLAA